MSKKPETYLITFEITSISHPNDWDWDELLRPTPEENYFIHSIGQISKNNEKEGD